jgi:hypothetical protein
MTNTDVDQANGKNLKRGKSTMSEQKQVGQLHAVVLQNLPEMTIEQRQKWINDPKGMQEFLSGLVGSKFSEHDGGIYFTVTSNGFSGKDWIKHFNKKGVEIGNYAKQLLLSEDFKPSKKGTTSQIVVIKGEFFSDNDRITSKIREEADRRNMTKPNAEVACLIRDLFTDDEIKAMGLSWIVTMHEPIKDSDGDPHLLSTNRNGNKSWLSTYYGPPDRRWHRGSGFAFVAPQV